MKSAADSSKLQYPNVQYNNSCTRSLHSSFLCSRGMRLEVDCRCQLAISDKLLMRDTWCRPRDTRRNQ